VRTELYDAVKEATRGELDLLGELDGGPGWMAYLARSPAAGALCLLVLQETPGEEFDLEVVEVLDATLAVGRTTCLECGTAADGWPRYCEACGRDLSGVAAGGAAGASDGELLDAVRAAADGEYEVLGAMRHAEGGGAVYFARDAGTGALVGLTLEREADGELALAVSWTVDDEALREEEASLPAGAAPSAVPAWTPEPRVEAPPVLRPEPVAAYVPSREAADPEPPRGRGDSRRVALYAAAGVLVVGAVAVLAFLLMSRPDGAAEGPLPGVAVEAAIQPSRPAGPAPSVSPPSAADPAPAPPPAPADPVPPSYPAPEVARTPVPRPAPPPPVEAPLPAPPAPVARDDGRTDAERIEAAIGGYAAAVQSRQIPRIRAAYPGITQAEVARWEELLIGVGTGNTLRVVYVLDDAPTVRGDEARVPFTLVLEFRGTRQLQPLRATLRRSGGGWRLEEVRLIG
jgi:hypothetical protein